MKSIARTPARAAWLGGLSIMVLIACQGAPEQPAVAVRGETESTEESKPGRSPNAAPDFALHDLEGRTVRLSDYNDRVVLINFWSTTCPPCRRELPDLFALQRQYGEEGFTVLGISLDVVGLAKVQAFVEDYGFNYPVLRGTQQVVVQYGNIRGIPTSFLLNRRHEPVGRWVGMVTRAQLTPYIDSLLRI